MFVLLQSKSLKASTLWSLYSMVKSTVQINDNVDISKYAKLIAFLKRQNDGYEAKKSTILTMDNIIKFFSDAPDDTFLLIKVALIFALNGACRRGELYKLNIEDIEDTGSILVITLHDTKTKKKRIFTVTSERNGIDGIELYRKYFSMRPKHVNHRKFFIYYKNGKCTVQPVGINSFANMPRKIAEYLQLPNSSSYTGHCLRRTSATLLADSGADIQMLKRHGGWRSSTVAEGYVEDSITNKVKTSKRIFNQDVKVPSLNIQQSTSSTSNQIVTSFSDVQSVAPGNLQSSGISFTNMTNCTINIYHENFKK